MNVQRLRTIPESLSRFSFQSKSVLTHAWIRF